VGSNWEPRDLADVKRRLIRWTEDADGPVKFVREVIGIEPVPDQAKLLRALGGFDSVRGKFGVTVRSGQGCGKSTAAAFSILWFLVCFRNSLVQATAPKEKQLHSVLWGELDKLIRGSRFLTSVLEWQATRIGVRNEASQWQAIARTARHVESIQGEHRDHMLLVIDEASGVEDRMLEALLGGLTEDHNLALMISNPTTTSGLFYDSHYKDAALWDTLHFSGRSSPLVNKRHIVRMEKKYGATSPIIAVRVDGDFPEQADTALISARWIEALQDRQPEGQDTYDTIMGVDVARYGADMSAVCIRRGTDIIFMDRWSGADIQESCGRVIALAKQFKAGVINVDECGIGAGLVDALHAQQAAGVIPKAEITGVNVATAADDTEFFPLLRDQLWCEWADRLRDGAVAYREGVDFDMREALESQCRQVEYKFTSSGQRKVESKDDMRKKAGGSPDLVDAMLFAFREIHVGLIGWI